MHLITKIKAVLKHEKFTPKRKKKFMTIIGGGILVLGIIYWLYARNYADTDDAYVNANVVQVAPQVTGKLLHLNVINNQFVKKGDLLFELDPEPFIVAVNKAKAEIGINEAKYINAKITAERVLMLIKFKAVSKQAADDAAANLQATEASVAFAKAALAQDELNLRYTRVFAANNGWVTNLTLREGNVVNENQPLFALVTDEQYWVDANFKETEMERIKPGQSAKIVVDLYPGHTFHGIVDSISSGSGAAFSLLPPQNATGNWVKITQRVPVKVIIKDPDSHYPLRIGTSATVTIKLSR